MGELSYFAPYIIIYFLNMYHDVKRSLEWKHFRTTCKVGSQNTGGFSSQGPVVLDFDAFFVGRLNTMLMLIKMDLSVIWDALKLF